MRMSGDHPNYCIIEIDQNPEKIPGDVRRLAVTQTPVKDHQLKTDVKTSQGVNNNNNNDNRKKMERPKGREQVSIKIEKSLIENRKEDGECLILTTGNDVCCKKKFQRKIDWKICKWKISFLRIRGSMRTDAEKTLAHKGYLLFCLFVCLGFMAYQPLYVI